MPRLPVSFLFTTPLLGAALFVGCGTGFESCEESRTCAPSDGDGDLGGNPGDGDGDGDGTGGGGGGAPSACDPECEGSAPHCDESEDPAVCVECLSETDCAGDEQCNADGECVACLENEHCEDADASLCEAQACAPCEDNDDCSHIADKGVCEDGLCVECTPGTDDRESDTDACGTAVCNPETLECDSGLVQNDKDICDSCIADSECLTGQNCIPLEYTGGAETAALGGFCMKIFPGCSAPYQAGAINRASLSGAPATDYCGLAEEFTTCAAIEDLKDGTGCDDDLDCGTEHGEGRCEVVNGGEDTQCTYSCTSSNQCVTGNACGGTVGEEYCGG